MACIKVKQDDNVGYNIKEVVCDTEADIASIPDKFAPGSKLICIETGKLYILNSEKEWILVGANNWSI